MPNTVRVAVPRRITVVLGFGLLLAASLVVVLGQRLTALSAAYAEIRTLATFLHPGSVVPAFRTQTLDGDSVTVGAAADTAARQLVFLFTTTCPYCQATLPVWRHLADSARSLGRRTEVVAISLDSVEATRAYATKHHLPYPVILFPNWRVSRLYRAGTVPTTLVLDGEGRVLYARVGLLTHPSVVDSIYRAVGPPPAGLAEGRALPRP